MNASSPSPWMIASAHNASVAGELEVTLSPAGPPVSHDPDPGDTVRLPTLERQARLLPVVG